jgi:hypothetical protein
VNVHGAGDGAHRTGADPIVLDGFEGLLAEPRMGRETEIIVRRKVDYRAMVDGRVRFLFVFQNAEIAEELLLAQRVELFSKVGERVGTHSRRV